MALAHRIGSASNFDTLVDGARTTPEVSTFPDERQAPSIASRCRFHVR